MEGGNNEQRIAIRVIPPTPPGSWRRPEEHSEITSNLVASADGCFIVAGKQNGDVALFSTADARQVAVLYWHVRIGSVKRIALAESRNLVISSDLSGKVMFASLEGPFEAVAARPELCARVVLRLTFGAVASSLLVNGPEDRVLVSGQLAGRYVDQVWEIPSGTVHHVGGQSQTVFHSVFQHPANPAWFVVVNDDIARIYCWADATEVSSPQGIRFARPPQPQRFCPITGTASYHIGPGFVLEMLRPSASSPARLYLWPAASLDPWSSTPAQPAVEPNLEAISSAVLAVLAITETATVQFVDVDLWICSADLRSVVVAAAAAAAPAASSSLPALPSSNGEGKEAVADAAADAVAGDVRRHFFASIEWRTPRGGELLCTVTRRVRGARRQVAVAFAAGHGLVVVHGGFHFSWSVVASPAEGPFVGERRLVSAPTASSGSG